MWLDIDLKKAREERILVLEKGIGNFRWYENIGINLLLAAVAGFMFGMVFFDQIFYSHFLELKSKFKWLPAIFCPGPMVLSFWTLMKMRRFKTIKGESLDANRAIAREIIEKMEWAKCRDNRNLILLTNSTSFLSNKQLAIVFSKNDVLVNCMSFTPSKDLPNPIAYWFHRYIVQNFIKDFRQKLAEHHHQQTNPEK